MKVTIELEDDSEVYFAINGSNYWMVLWELDQWLRSQIKYNEKITQEELDAYEKVREQLRELCDNNKVKLDV